MVFQELSVGIDGEQIVYISNPPKNWDEKIMIKITNGKLNNPTTLYTHRMSVSDCESLILMLQQTLKIRRVIERAEDKSKGVF